MTGLKPYNFSDIEPRIRQRSGERKLGESLARPEGDWENWLAQSAVKFVIIGIAEDIGVRANFGRAGAGSAFGAALDSFLNQQDNPFLNAAGICVLGEVVTEDLLQRAAVHDPGMRGEPERLRALVRELDERVSDVIGRLIGLGKIPVVIGGGHNNAMGNICGASRALKRKVNAINCDAHLDFRPAEGRHSGNGFRYAFEEGYLERYAVLPIHEQYNNAQTLRDFGLHPGRLHYSTFESIFVREEKTFLRALRECIGFVSGAPCGIELDLDAIENVPSSARTSSGISVLQARQYIHQCAGLLDALYLHIAEGAPVLAHRKADNKTGKLIAYLVTDFIKACSARVLL